MLLRVLELVGIGVFAISGALEAGRKRLDLIGVLALAFVTSMGGGTIRDVLLNRHPLVWLVDPTYLIVIAGSAFLTIGYVKWRRPPERSLLVADALGLALFSVTGAQIAQRAGLPAISGIVLGTLTGSAGGVVRDVLSAEIPMVFRPGSLYATAAIAGTSCYFLLDWLGTQRQVASLIGIAVVAVVRLAAIWWGLELPAFHLTAELRAREKPPAE